jgi:predicted membrane protein
MKCISILLLVFFTFSVLAARPQAQAQWQDKIITFDAPGAGTGPGQGTTPNGIDSRGAIVGWYLDAGNVNHGFVRDPDGTITTIDVPGAGTGDNQGTVAEAMNASGAITGMYFDANCLYHGFLRDPDGGITTFDVPGAATVGGICTTGTVWLVMQGTAAGNINAAGTITGIYTDPSGVGHVFLRDPDGTFTTFDAPGAGTGAVQGTWSSTFYGLNPAGAISGWYLDSGNAVHGFLRTAKGKVTTFDVPGGGTGAIQGTVPLSLNPEREVTGFYLDGSSVFHGFLRSPRGKLTTFDVPGSGTGFFQGPLPYSNNPAGAITGTYTDTNNVNHGFLRAPDGKLTTFDVPGSGAGAYQGTVPYGNNAAGAITGNYIDANGVSHGFIRLADDGQER